MEEERGSAKALAERQEQYRQWRVLGEVAVRAYALQEFRVAAVPQRDALAASDGDHTNGKCDE
jgi:hypothetical protein